MAGLKGKVIHGYEMQEEVGRGAMGVVYKAKQLSMDRIVALKFLPKSLARDKKRVQRFIREARAAGQLSSPHIVHVHDVGQMDGLYFISMEFVDGTTAQKHLKAHGPFPEEEAVEFGLQIASALKEAHEHGILHRDVKPDNFLIGQNKRAHLSDLGLARFDDKTGEDGHLTQDGTALGTPHYMSPEQAQGTAVDARSDLYGLGASLYVMASGKTPFEGPTAAVIMLKVLKEKPRPLKAAAPGLSSGFIAVVEKLMQKDPAKRFQKAQDVIEALGKVKAGEYMVSGSGTTTARALRVRSRGAAGGRAAGRAVSSASHSGSPGALYAGLGLGAVVLLGGFFMLGTGGGGSTRHSRRKHRSTAVQVNKPNAPLALAKADPGRVQREAAAQKAFQKLAAGEDAALKAHPSALAKAWEAFAKAHEGSKLAAKARQKARAARAAAKTVQGQWDEAKRSADTALAEGNAAAALRILSGFLERNGEAAQAAEARQRIVALTDQAVQALKDEIRKSFAAADSGDFREARRLLQEAGTKAGAALAQEAGLPDALKKIEGLERKAQAKNGAAVLADRKELEKAHKKAEAFIRGPTARFDFKGALKVYQGAARRMASKEMQLRSALWAERYGRAAKLWTRTGQEIEKGSQVQLDRLGPYRGGRVLGWSEQGVQYKPIGLPPQTVPWKNVKGGDAAALAWKLHAAGMDAGQILDHGLLAYAAGAWAPAEKWLDEARQKDASLKALAGEPHERAKAALAAARETRASEALNAAQKAFRKKDRKTARARLALLQEGGELARTAFAREHAARIKQLSDALSAAAKPKLAAKPKPVSVARKNDGKNELLRIGWTQVEGAWTKDPKRKGAYTVKDGKLILDAKDATVQLTVNVKPGTKVSVFVRRRNSDDLAQSFGGNRLPGNMQANIKRFVQGIIGDKEIAQGYGLKIANNKAKVFAPNGSGFGGGGGDRGGRGRGGRRGRGRRWGGQGGNGMMGGLRFVPVKAEEWEMPSGTHTITISAKGDKLKITTKSSAAERATSKSGLWNQGQVEIRVEGEAGIFQPFAKRR